MEVKLEKVYPLAAPAAAAWRVLQDIRGVAECMPGAQITEQVDPANFKGQVSVKVGPASAMFSGNIAVNEVNPAQRRLSMVAKGGDARGSSAASMDLVASIREIDAARCELVGVARVTVSGKMAAFGGRMLTQVSDQILQQFAANFASRVAGGGHAGAVDAPPPNQLNAVVLMWRVIVSFFHGLFAKKA